MTPDNREPRKRRRRRRRSQSALGVQGPSGGNGPFQPPSGGNNANPQGGEAPYPSPGGGRRRRRSRHRRRQQMFAPDIGTAPIEIPSGELIPTSGVLFIKPNGSGMLVQSANNFVPQHGDAIVPRSMIDRLHLQSGLLLAGSARRAGNNIEFVG